MKKSMLLLSILMRLIQSTYGQDTDKSKKSYGILFMAGGRYDNYRMCVASPAGVKGGPIADIMFISKLMLNDGYSLTFNLPIMRPILFGLAFKMLQFEPELTLEYNKYINEKINLITGPGVGISFHYGPDNKSELNKPSESFFAMGPLFSWQTGIELQRKILLKVELD